MNAVSYFDQILAVTPKETALVRTLTSHLRKHPSKTNKTCKILLENQRRIHK